MSEEDALRSLRDGARDGARLGGVILLFALGYLGVAFLLGVAL